MVVDGTLVTVTTGFTVSVALADFEVSATLVAVTVIVCCDEILADAVYKPLLRPDQQFTQHGAEYILGNKIGQFE